ncbi:MAG TPA: response regulator, partial [Syntrophorhabdaceae bacterium]|nr:response regulator [Syntrophorhabdaceae bacterium]
PFFTTKEVGKGTGLGLSMVYGIVKQNNGYINVYSELGHGTIFKIYMPLMSLEPEKKKAEASFKPRGGNEMVLLAEDDIGTRGIIKTLLQEYGYNVIEAVDGEDAVEKYHECSERISLLIVDVIMPKKNGKAVFDEIRKDHPDVRALFVSGYTADIIHKRGLIEPDLHFMEKPIIANQFLTKVRSLLDMNR